jgi:hypothetical protein
MQGGWQPPPRGGSGHGPPRYDASYGPDQVPRPTYTPPMSFGAYEFNAYENTIIGATARKAKLWGTISTVIGVLQLIGSCGMVKNPYWAGGLPAGIVAVVIGVTFVGVGRSLSHVVVTQGDDIKHLMQAMEKLGTAFTINIITTIIGVVAFGVLAALLAFVFVTGTAAR